MAPQGEDFDKAAAWWLSLASGPDAEFDDVVTFNAADIEPTVTWGITPAQSLGISQSIPTVSSFPESEHFLIGEALQYMGLTEGQPIEGTKIDVAFVGELGARGFSPYEKAFGVSHPQRLQQVNDLLRQYDVSA